MSTSQARHHLLGEEKVFTAIAKLAGPAIVGMLINAVYNFVDSLYVSWIGTEAMSAAQVGFPVFMLIAAFGQMYGIGGSSYVSRQLGERQMDEANTTATVVYATTIATTLVITTLGLAAINPLLGLFGATEANLAFASDYVTTLLLGAVFIMGNMTLNNLLRAEGSSKFSMIALVLGAVLNIVLDPLFIFTFGMGIKGAAIATVLSQAMTTVFLLSVFLRGKTMLKLHPRWFKPNRTLYKEVFAIGTPTLIRQFLASFAIGLMNQAASVFGIEAVAAMGIVSKVFMMGMYTLMGYVQGYMPVAGYSYGAKKFQRVLSATRTAILVSTAYCIIVYLGLTLLTEPIISMFRPEPAVQAITIKALRIWAISLPILGYAVVVSMLFQAIGRAKEAAALSISRQGIMLIPLILILPGIFGLDGVMWAQPAADLLTLGLTIILHIRVNKQLDELQTGIDNPSKESIQLT